MVTFKNNEEDEILITQLFQANVGIDIDVGLKTNMLMVLLARARVL